MKSRFGPRSYIPQRAEAGCEATVGGPNGGLGDRYLPRVKRSCEAGLNREAVQAAEQFLLRGYIPLSKGAWGFECNEVDLGNGLSEVRVKSRRQKTLDCARPRREKDEV
jgi:hypothetical protein